MRPEHGGRIELVLARADERGARYASTLSTAERSWSGSVEVAAGDGAVVIDVPDDPPAWLVDVVRGVVRAGWRARAEAGWPRRLTRWRAGPEEGR